MRITGNVRWFNKQVCGLEPPGLGREQRRPRAVINESGTR